MEQMEQWNTISAFEWGEYSETFQTAFHHHGTVRVFGDSSVYAHDREASRRRSEYRRLYG